MFKLRILFFWSTCIACQYAVHLSSCAFRLQYTFLLLLLCKVLLCFEPCTSYHSVCWYFLRFPPIFPSWFMSTSAAPEDDGQPSMSIDLRLRHDDSDPYMLRGDSPPNLPPQDSSIFLHSQESVLNLSHQDTAPSLPLFPSQNSRPFLPNQDSVPGLPQHPSMLLHSRMTSYSLLAAAGDHASLININREAHAHFLCTVILSFTINDLYS